jgi:hypothetical protein
MSAILGDTRREERLRAGDAVALDAWVGVQCRSARRVPVASQRLLIGQVIAPPLPPAPSTLSRPAGLVRRALLNVDRYALTALYRRANLAMSDPLVGKVNPRTPSGEALALAVRLPDYRVTSFSSTRATGARSRSSGAARRRWT